MAKEVIVSRPQCSSCGKIRPSGWIANLWIVCKWCESGWFCPTCWGIHGKACKEKYLRGQSLQPQPAAELDLGTLPNGQKITVDPSERCAICVVGVQQAECVDCGAYVCGGCCVAKANGIGLCQCAACYAKGV